MIVITDDYMLDPDIEAPVWHTRILSDNIARDGSVSASSNDSAEGHINAPASDQTFEWWRPNSMPAWWAVDAGGSVDVDCVGIAVHDMPWNGATAQVQYSNNGSSWNDIDGAFIAPANESPIMILFKKQSARYWRVRFAGDFALPPRVGVIHIGKAIAMPRPVQWMGHTPGTLNANTIKRASQSERGQRLGTTVIRIGFDAAFTVDNLDEDWVRGYFAKFMRQARRYGYFIAWRPTQFPREVLYGWADDDIVPENAQGGTTRLMSVSWDMMAHGSYDEQIYPWGG